VLNERSKNTRRRSGSGSLRDGVSFHDGDGWGSAAGDDEDLVDISEILSASGIGRQEAHWSISNAERHKKCIPGLGGGKAESALRPKKISQTSTERLLHASLKSLDTLGRQLESESLVEAAVGGAKGGNGGGGPSRGKSFDRSVSGAGRSGGSKRLNFKDFESGAEPRYEEGYPTVDFLEGCVWMARNALMLTDDLSERNDILRGKYLRDLAIAAEDGDLRRSTHRLNLLAGSMLSEFFSLTQAVKTKARNLLQVLEPFSYYPIPNLK